MSWTNFDGLSDWGPSESASSGLGCTSMMSPSAPHATAPLAMGATRSQCPVPCDGSTTTGRCESFLSTGTALRSRVKRVDVSKVRMPRGENVLRRKQELLDARGHAALEEHRLAHFAHPAEQREVLNVPRADLQDVGVLSHQLHALRLEDFRHDGQPGAFARVRQVLEPLLLEPLEGVWRGARLEGAPAEDLGARRLDRVGHLPHLRLRLHRAGAGHDHDGLASDGNAIDAHLGGLRPHLAARELERLLHGHDRLHRLHRFEEAEIRPAPLLAHGGDDGLELAADNVRRIAHLRDATADVVDGRVPDTRFQDDDHSDLPRICASGRSSAMRAAKRSGLSDCGPSESASAGLLCTSMMSPSAPAASPALAMADTYSQCPVPCDGSTRMGRWESFLTTGMALRSRV